MSKIIPARNFLLILGFLLLAACGAGVQTSAETPVLADEAKSPISIEPTTIIGNLGEEADAGAPVINVRVQDDNEYDFPFLIPFDGIAPVYEPEFVTAQEAPLLDEELIIGIAWGGEAKAYPISVLRFREMVNDELAGIPTLVTW